MHINQLKKCFDALTPACTAPELTSDEEKALENTEDTQEPAHLRKKVRTPSPHINQDHDTERSENINHTKYNLRKNPRKKVFILITQSLTLLLSKFNLISNLSINISILLQ